MTVERPILRKFLRPTTTGTNSAINWSEFLATPRKLLKVREKSHLQGALGFGFCCSLLKKWREIFKPITNGRIHNCVNTRKPFKRRTNYHADTSGKTGNPNLELLQFRNLRSFHNSFVLCKCSTCMSAPSQAKNRDSRPFCSPELCVGFELVSRISATGFRNEVALASMSFNSVLPMLIGSFEFL